MGKIKEMNIKNRTYYFFNNIINIEGLDVSCKSQNHPQTSQTTHKPPKPPTDYSQTSQITHKPSTNLPKHP